MKVLCVIDSLGSGGAQRQLVGLAIGFKERGHVVSFLVYHNLNFFEGTLEQAQIPVYAVIESNYFKRFLKMRKFIRKGNYDSVLSFLDAPNLICELAGLPNRKWNLIVGERSANPAILKSLKLRAFRWLHLLADYVVANSHENIKIVRKINPLLPPKKCQVIYNMVDLEKWKPSENYFPRKTGKFILVIAASHQYLKNLNGLINAVNLLEIDLKNNLEVNWYGDERDDSKTKGIELILQKKLGSIIKFYPASITIEKAMQKADAVGLFSFYEGLPNSLCEGMACAKPIIATDVSDVNLLIENGKNGFVVKDLSDLTIRNSLTELLNCSNNDLMRLGKNGRMKAEKLFDKEIIISTYLTLMREV